MKYLKQIIQSYPGIIFVTALSYLVAGKLGFFLAVPMNYATAFFPSSGIALATLLLWGKRSWPGVYLGALALHSWAFLATDQVIIGLTNFWLPFVLSLGALAQALFGVYLIRRFVGDGISLEKEKDIVTFLFFGGAVSSLISASICVPVLFFVGYIQKQNFFFNWWTWWVGDTIGVLIVIPILFSFLAKPRTIWKPRIISVALPLVLVSFFIIGFYFQVNEWEKERLYFRFKNQVNHLSHFLQSSFIQYIQIPGFIERLYGSSSNIDRNEFRAFVERSLSHYAGIQALEWIPRISHAERTRFEKRIRKEGFPNFQITERTNQGKMSRAKIREEYYPVLFVEPLSGNKKALGFDLASNPTRLEAIATSRDSGKMLATSRITLVQEKEKQFGLLLLYPVYHDGNRYQTVEARRKYIRGFALAVFRVGNMVKHALHGINRQNIFFRLLDTTAPKGKQEMYASADSENVQLVPELHWSSTFDMVDRQWLFEFAATQGYSMMYRSWYAWLVTAGGLLFASMLGGFLLIISGRTSRIEQVVAERTQQLEELTHTVQSNNDVLNAISRVQASFIGKHDTQFLFDHLLGELLGLTESEYGYFAEIQLEENGGIQLVNLVESSNLWENSTSLQNGKNEQVKNFAYHDLKVFSDHVILAKEPCIFNNPKTLFEQKKISERTFLFKSFLGIPLFRGTELVSIACVINREDGYQQSLTDRIQPFLTTCVNLIDALKTESRRITSEQHLLDSESRMRGILNTAVEGIITINEHGIMESINPAGAKLFGYTIEEMQGQNINMLTPSPHRENHDSYIRNYLKTGVAKIIGFSREVNGRRKDGTMIPLDLSISDIQLKDRRLFTGILHDLREHKRIDQIKNEFVSTVSHELRTPLTSIFGGLKMALAGIGGEIPDKARSMLEIAFNNSERLNMLVNDILDIQKIESGKMVFQFHHMDIVSLVKHSVKNNNSYAEKYKVQFKIIGDFPDRAIVNGDENRLNQIMANLLSNAAKFSPSGEDVKVQILRREATVEVSVIDNGTGIPEEFQSKIFQQFAQADSSNTRQKGGSGLGLSITKALIENHGGKIGFESTDGKGTRFYFTIPVIENSD